MLNMRSKEEGEEDDTSGYGETYGWGRGNGAGIGDSSCVKTIALKSGRAIRIDYGGGESTHAYLVINDNVCLPTDGLHYEPYRMTAISNGSYHKWFEVG